MQFDSIEEARAALSFGRLTFRCLMCGKNHRWESYDSISKTMRDCLNRSWRHTALTNVTKLHPTKFARTGRLGTWMPLSVPDLPFWRIPLFPEYDAEFKQLSHWIKEIIRTTMEPYNIYRNSICLPDDFPADEYVDLSHKCYQSTIKITCEPAFLALTPKAAATEVRQSVMQMHRICLDSCKRAASLFGDSEFATAYSKFVDKYCSDPLPTEGICFITDNFVGLVDADMPTARLSNSSLRTAVRHCYNIVYASAYGRQPQSWLVHSPAEIAICDMVMFCCLPDGAYVVEKQRGYEARVEYTQDYVVWKARAATVPHFPLSDIDERAQLLTFAV